MINPEPLLVIGPRPTMPSVKMFGNMIELKNPHRISDQIATCPVVIIDTSTIAVAANPKIPSSRPEGIMLTSHAPSRRPTSAPAQ